MDNKISTYSPAFSIVSSIHRWWYRLPLCRAMESEMQLNEKGYYFAVLVFGLFLRLIKRLFGTSEGIRPLSFIII